MIDHVWTVLCSMVSTAKETNNVSLLNVVEQINLGAQPSEEDSAIRLDLVLISLWARADPDEPAVGQALFEILDPSGEQLIAVPGTLDLKRFERLRTPVGIEGIKFRGFGRYRFKVHYRNSEEEAWQLVASVPLRIVRKLNEHGDRLHELQVD